MSARSQETCRQFTTGALAPSEVVLANWKEIFRSIFSYSVSTVNPDMDHLKKGVLVGRGCGVGQAEKSLESVRGNSRIMHISLQNDDHHVTGESSLHMPCRPDVAS